jgi:hypothetical protein
MQMDLFNSETVKLEAQSNSVRECNKCHEVKDLEDFHVPYYKKNNEKGRSHTCKACIKRQTKETKVLRAENPPPADSCCELCGIYSNRLHLDHNHLDASFRGYLCANCNQALGKFKDNKELLRLAIDYLERKQ